MEAMNALATAAKTAEVPTTHIGPKMGKGANYFSAVKSRGSVPRCDTMAAMADVCGYKLALIPRDKVPPSAVVIDPPR